MLQNEHILFHSSIVKKTVEKLMTAQDSLCIATVRGRIKTAANFNECKKNVFILLIIFSANLIKQR